VRARRLPFRRCGARFSSRLTLLVPRLAPAPRSDYLFKLLVRSWRACVACAKCRR
jgi:hypothetical protein